MSDPINLQTDITTLTTEQKAALYRRVRGVRLDTQKWLAPVEAMEKALKEALIADIPKSGDGIVYSENGVRRVMTITSKEKPIIGDWNKLIEALVAAGRFDLLQKRLAERAVQDIEGWKGIPGIEALNVLDISDTKV